MHLARKTHDYEPGELIFRSAAVQLMSFVKKQSAEEIVTRYYRREPGLEAIVTKAASAPGNTTTSDWAASLLSEQVASFVDLLTNNSVYGALRPVGVGFNFEGSGSIKVPARTNTKLPAGAFVEEGGAIPVRELSFTSQTLTRHKMGVIVTTTQELLDATAGEIENYIRQAILDETSKILDARLLDNAAASTTRPVGLLNGVTSSTSAGATAANIIADLKTLLGAFTNDDAFKNLRILINPQRALGMATATNSVGDMPFAADVERGNVMGAGLVVSANVPTDEVYVVNAGEFISAYDGPEFQVSTSATLHMEDTSPAAIGESGSPNTVAAPVRSLFQTDTVGIKMVLPVTWAMRRAGQVAALDTVAW